MYYNKNQKVKGDTKMKKLLAFVMASVITLSTTAVFAADEVAVKIDGKDLATDVPAQIIDDRTMVPMRAIFETLGANVQWAQDSQAIFATKGAKLIVMKIGVKALASTVIGGESQTTELDVAPQIVDDRTLVPVRAISEALDCTVDWNGETRTVTITTAQPQPAPEATTAPQTAE